MGALGANWIDARVLVLDYPGSRLTLCPKAPDAFPDDDFEPFSFRGRRVFFPAEVDGESVSLWLDTGPSAFKLMTDEQSFRAMALEGVEEEVYPSQSWGRTIQVHDIAANSSIVLDLTEIPLRRVSFVEWSDSGMSQLFDGTGLGGMCGNLLFTNHTLILDAKGQRFWVGE